MMERQIVVPEGCEILTKEAYSDLCLRASRSEEYEKAIDKMLSLINSGNRGSADYFIVDQIESIINQLRAGKETSTICRNKNDRDER